MPEDGEVDMVVKWLLARVPLDWETVPDDAILGIVEREAWLVVTGAVPWEDRLVTGVPVDGVFFAAECEDTLIPDVI